MTDLFFFSDGLECVNYRLPSAVVLIWRIMPESCRRNSGSLTIIGSLSLTWYDVTLRMLFKNCFQFSCSRNMSTHRFTQSIFTSIRENTARKRKLKTSWNTLGPLRSEARSLQIKKTARVSHFWRFENCRRITLYICIFILQLPVSRLKNFLQTSKTIRSAATVAKNNTVEWKAVSLRQRKTERATDRQRDCHAARRTAINQDTVTSNNLWTTSLTSVFERFS